jgi:hypothetical protein
MAAKFNANPRKTQPKGPHSEGPGIRSANESRDPELFSAFGGVGPFQLVGKKTDEGPRGQFRRPAGREDRVNLR